MKNYDPKENLKKNSRDSMPVYIGDGASGIVDSICNSVNSRGLSDKLEETAPRDEITSIFI